MHYDAFQDRICALFESLAGVRRRPYGQVCGLYYGDCFFGIVAHHKLYFRTNDFTKQWYVHRDMQRFPTKMDDAHEFYEVPPAIIERPTFLMKLAREAMAVCREQVPESPTANSIDW